jgi:hypothetical protein
MQKVKWLAGLYLDERSSEPQVRALESISTGQVGGHPAVISAFFKRLLGVRTVPIAYWEQGEQRELRIPGFVTANIHAILGQDGADVTVTGHPLCIAPGEPAVVALSDEVSLDDFGWRWRFSGRTGCYSPFEY